MIGKQVLSIWFLYTFLLNVVVQVAFDGFSLLLYPSGGLCLNHPTDVGLTNF